MDCHFRDLPLISHYSCLGTLEIGQIRKWQSIRNYSWNYKFSTKFDDLGVIIMKKRCSIQQSERNNCWSEQSSEKSTVWTVPFFCGPPGISYMSDSLLVLFAVLSFNCIVFCDVMIICTIPKVHSHGLLKEEIIVVRKCCFMYNTQVAQLETSFKEWCQKQ